MTVMNNRTIAVVFPGQGSQRPGMGKDFYDNSAVAKDTYREASEALGFDVTALCFEENDRLNLTENAQPCILATEIAMYRSIVDRWGIQPECFGGHSLGEYTALVTAGVMPFAEALRTVRTRGSLMQEAAPVGTGGMAAVICEGINRDELGRLIADLPVDIANVNAENQLVLSGKREGLDEAGRRLETTLEKKEGYRFVPLEVSAPFHSRFMKVIEEPFHRVLENMKAVKNPEAAATVTSNFTGRFHDGTYGSIVNGLVRQLSHTVRWTDNMASIASRARLVFEIGPGRPLRKLFATMGVDCASVTTFGAAQRAFAGAGEEQP
jgi:[acyl-carrier-protein] S-malonyltransferase